MSEGGTIQFSYSILSSTTDSDPNADVGVFAGGTLNAYRNEQAARHLADSALKNESNARGMAEQSADSVSRLSEMFAKLKLDGSPSGLLGRAKIRKDFLESATQNVSDFFAVLPE